MSPLQGEDRETLKRIAQRLRDAANRREPSLATVIARDDADLLDRLAEHGWSGEGELRKRLESLIQAFEAETERGIGSTPWDSGRWAGRHEAFREAATQLRAVLTAQPDYGTGEKPLNPRVAKALDDHIATRRGWAVGQVLRHPVGSEWLLAEHLGGQEDDWRAECVTSMSLSDSRIGEVRTFHREYMDRTFTVIAEPEAGEKPVESGEGETDRERADRLEVECRELEDANRSLAKMRDVALEGKLATTQPVETQGAEEQTDHPQEPSSEAAIAGKSASAERSGAAPPPSAPPDLDNVNRR